MFLKNLVVNFGILKPEKYDFDTFKGLFTVKKMAEIHRISEKKNCKIST
jgi:uncharacterized protein YfkK (UPF0435 family)